MQSLSTVAHHKPGLLAGQLPPLLPRLYQQTVRQRLSRHCPAISVPQSLHDPSVTPFSATVCLQFYACQTAR